MALQVSSVELLRSVSFRPHWLQEARSPCPSPNHRACINLWCHLTISSSVIPFSSCLQSFPASGSFPMSQFFELGCQSIWASVSTAFLPMNIQDWFPLGFTGWSPCSSRDSRVFSDTAFKSVNTLAVSFLYGPNLTSVHDCWKNHSFD